MYPGIILFVLGTLVGSFIAAFSYRYPREISIVKGRSFCPGCKEKVSWFDNIPLLSFLLLRGVCRNCKKSISLRYPAIELAVGLGFYLIGVDPFWLAIFSVLITIFIIDIENQIIPDELVFLGLILVVIRHLLFTSLFAGFFCAAILLFLHLITKSRGMGLGDVKFAVFGGSLIGLRLSLVWLNLAFLTGGVIALILILGRRAGLKSKIAFGPFLIISIFLTFLYGEKILLWLNFK